MKVVILSDTHLSSMEGLDRRLIELVKKADAVIHAGDYTELGFFEELKEISNSFYGVCGNMDSYELKDRLEPVLVIEFEGVRIGITHPIEGGPPLWTRKRARGKFEGVDLVIYGHTHFPDESYEDGILCFNPGSATGAFPAFRKTYGVLEVKGGEIKKLKVVKL